MFPSMHTSTKEIVTMIERIDHHPHDLPAAKRFGYAVGLVGVALQKGYTKHELKCIICSYVAAQKQELTLAEHNMKSDVQIMKKIGHRELLCRDMLSAITNMENNDKSREAVKANTIATWSKDVVVVNDFAVYNDIQPVVDEDLVVIEDHDDTPEFVLIAESDAESSVGGASDWEIV